MCIFPCFATQRDRLQTPLTSACVVAALPHCWLLGGGGKCGTAAAEYELAGVTGVTILRNTRVVCPLCNTSRWDLSLFLASQRKITTNSE